MTTTTAEAQPRNIAILGSTGSIGCQTLDIIAEYPDKFRAYLLTANTSVERLARQALTYHPTMVVIADESKYGQLAQLLDGTGICVKAGMAAIIEAMAKPEIDTVVAAMVGYAGLPPTIEAIKHHKKIALANKETLVVAGDLITRLVAENNTALYPIDSEHGAIWQCLAGERHDDIYKLILTASGGPFRTKSRDELRHVTKEDALKHPNWSMGAKITIDSATMMNKGFEVMEAKWLFGIGLDKIEVVIHPQSIVHSMVEYVDGSIKAQIGLPDMHIPIRYALGCGHRLYSASRRLTVGDYRTLTFETPDTSKFPLLAMAYEVAQRAGNMPCALNAANEVAVAAFLHDRIKFVEMPGIIAKAISSTSYIEHPSYDDYVSTNAETRSITEEVIKQRNIN